MNVLFITHNDHFYGSSKSLLSLLDGLKEYDLNPFVVVPGESGFTEALAVRQIPYQIIPLSWWMSTKRLPVKAKIRWLRDLGASIKSLEKWIAAWHIDAVYTNTSVIPAGRLAALRRHLPHIWHIREFGDLDFSLKFIFPRALSLRLMSSSAAVICNSKAVMNHLFHPGTNRVHLIYNGSAAREQFDSFLERRSHSSRMPPFTFAMVSLVSPKKGQEAAIRAAAELYRRGMPVKLLIAGHGREAYVNYLQELVNHLGISSFVNFLGFLTDPYQVYNACDCVLVCSEHEALSRVALEAMSCAVPLIARQSGGTPEIIENEQTGLLFSTQQELVENMSGIAADPGWAIRLGLAGWQCARERFNIENYAASVYNIIKSTLPEK